MRVLMRNGQVVNPRHFNGEAVVFYEFERLDFGSVESWTEISRMVGRHRSGPGYVFVGTNPMFAKAIVSQLEPGQSGYVTWSRGSPYWRYYVHRLK